MLSEVVTNCEIKPNMVINLGKPNMIWTDTGFEGYIRRLCHGFFEKYFEMEFKKYESDSQAT
jgi:hypothetical protein